MRNKIAALCGGFGGRERFRKLLILRGDLRRGGIEIEICGLGQGGVLPDTVETRADEQRKGKVGITQRIGRTQLRAPLFALRCRNPDEL